MLDIVQRFIHLQDDKKNPKKSVIIFPRYHQLDVVRKLVNDAFMDVVIGRMAQNQQFCERVLDDAKFGDTVRDLLIGVVYDRLRRPTDAQL